MSWHYLRALTPLTLANAQGNEDRLLMAHPLYQQLGHEDKARQEAYRELFRSHIDDEMLHEIRHALNHEVVLGRSYFKDKVEAMTQRQVRLGKPGRPRIEEERGWYLVCA